MCWLALATRLRPFAQLADSGVKGGLNHCSGIVPSHIALVFIWAVPVDVTFVLAFLVCFIDACGLGLRVPSHLLPGHENWWCIMTEGVAQIGVEIKVSLKLQTPTLSLWRVVYLKTKENSKNA